MLINRIIILILLILLLIYIFLANNITEGYMAIIGPIITYKEKKVNKPVNNYYKNMKITQDFAPNSVLTTIQ